VTGHLGYLFGAHICAIVLHDPQTGCLSTMSPAYGLSDAETREFALPRTLRADVDASMHDGAGASYIVRDTLVAECDDCREFGQRWSASTVLVAPLRNYRRFIGYLALTGRASAFNEEAGYLLATFAGLIAAAIDANLLVLALRDRADKLSSALAEIEEVDRLKDELIQNVSHELRLPLMVIQGYADLAKTGAFGPLHPDLQRAIEVISDKAAVLGRRVGDFVVLRGLHRTDLQLSRVSLAALAREAIERAKPGAAQNGIVFKDDIIPETLPLFADRRRMEQVIDELLGNAVKFSPDGGRVFVTVREGGDVVYLKVADQGIGIPPSQINRIWDQFYQFDGSTTRRFGGTGIGLAVVKQILEAHGGQVWVESQEGQGSQFYVALRMGHPDIGKAGSES
jgi:signal transduction histidine kinase